MNDIGTDKNPLTMVNGEPLIDAEAANEPAPSAILAPPRTSRLVLGLGLMLTALNLRLIFPSLAAVLPELVEATGLRPGAVSVLTMLPVLCMGAFAPLAPRLAARIGAERTILWVLLVLAAGTALRGFGTYPTLMVGALLAGGSIAIGNVLIPGLIKRDFPDRLPLMTGLFTLAMCLSAGLGAGLTVPIQRLMAGSWALALGGWGLLALPALLLWLPQIRAAGPAIGAKTTALPSLWRNRLAWQVTLFMGLQSALAYCVFGYLAPILRDRGMDGAAAGWIVSWVLICECLGCLLVPMLVGRFRDQRWLNVASFIFGFVGLIGCMFGPFATVWFWAALSGLGQGALITLAVTVIVLRSTDARMAAQLSGMAQSVGYALASLGPLLVGVLKDATGSYAPSAVMCLAVTLVGGWCGFGAGRNRHIIVERPLEAPGTGTL